MTPEKAIRLVGPLVMAAYDTLLQSGLTDREARRVVAAAVAIAREKKR